MRADNEPKFLYSRRLGQPMGQLLADPFSDLTRKRQVALFIAATVTLLLSVNLITIAQAGVEGFEFTLSTPQIAKWLAFAVTSYTLAVYLLGAREDWAIAKAKAWSRLAEIEDINATMAADQQERARGDVERVRELEQLRTQRQSIIEEREKRLREIATKKKEIETEIAKLPEMSNEQLEKRSSLHRLLESNHRIYLEFESRLDPIEMSMHELVSRISFKPDILMRAEQADIKPAIRSFSRLTKLRIVCGVLFPMAYTVFALVWAILH